MTHTLSHSLPLSLSLSIFCVDTEGSFIIERVAEIAKAAVQHLTNTEDTDNDDEGETSCDQL